MLVFPGGGAADNTIVITILIPSDKSAEIQISGWITKLKIKTTATHQPLSSAYQPCQTDSEYQYRRRPKWLQSGVECTKRSLSFPKARTKCKPMTEYAMICYHAWEFQHRHVFWDHCYQAFLDIVTDQILETQKSSSFIVSIPWCYLFFLFHVSVQVYGLVYFCGTGVLEL